MVVKAGSLIRPPEMADYRGKSILRARGITLATVGFMAAMIAFISSLILAGFVADKGNSLSGIETQGAWTFGVSSTALVMVKGGIALILLGILRRLWVRVESIKQALPKLVPQGGQEERVNEGPIRTPFGAGRVSRKAPGGLPIHRMAYAMWAPMLLMGAMAVMVALVLSFIWAGAADDGNTADKLTLHGLTKGTMFLGEGLFLSGIAFLLGSILGSLRQGGGEVQETVGRGVKTLVMPMTAKLFVGVMMMGLMIEMVQFGFYIFVATLDGGTPEGAASITAYFTWLGPLREAGLGVILSGIVLALGTIGTVLGFQFSRIQEL
jgi:hypothetical protein